MDRTCAHWQGGAPRAVEPSTEATGRPGTVPVAPLLLACPAAAFGAAAGAVVLGSEASLRRRLLLPCTGVVVALAAMLDRVFGSGGSSLEDMLAQRLKYYM